VLTTSLTPKTPSSSGETKEAVEEEEATMRRLKAGSFSRTHSAESTMDAESDMREGIDGRVMGVEGRKQSRCLVGILRSLFPESHVMRGFAERRGPGMHTCTVRWDRLMDRFDEGKSKIKGKRSETRGKGKETSKERERKKWKN
jgi:hypothetical protein